MSIFKRIHGWWIRIRYPTWIIRRRRGTAPTFEIPVLPIRKGNPLADHIGPSPIEPTLNLETFGMTLDDVFVQVGYLKPGQKLRRDNNAEEG